MIPRPAMRFCLLTTFYPPYNFGGDGIDVQRTARALVRRGHEVTVVHDVNAYEWLSGRRIAEAPAEPDGVEVVALRSRLGVVSPLLTHQIGHPVVHRRRIERLIAARRFDVVVFNNVSLVGGPGLLSLGGDALRVYVAHEHWLVCPTHVLWKFNREPCTRPECLQCVLAYKRPPQLWRLTGALGRQAAHVDLFIARSEFSREKHREFGFDRPMEVLPYFLPDTPPRPPSARPHARPYVLFVGRLTKIKGVESIIPAFERLPDVDLLVIGDGEEFEPLTQLAARVPNVKFLGRVANDALGPYYEHALAAVVPSLGFETFGIVLIEAFRNRTPVIARRIGPFPEIVDTAGGGLLFSTTDELVSAVDRLHRDRAFRDALADRGYRASWDLWSEQVVIDRYLDLVTEASGRRDARRT
jgi:glycosyltransferase involved in cell wall biosynthesis